MIEFGSQEAIRIARRDRLLARIMADNGAKGSEQCRDHLFDGWSQVALCGAARGHVAEICRPYDPDAPAFDDAGICPECVAILEDAP